jgi:hypothetical protein
MISPTAVRVIFSAPAVLGTTSSRAMEKQIIIPGDMGFRDIKKLR